MTLSAEEQPTITNKTEAAFLVWFRAVYGREWDDISNDRHDDESLNARRGYESGYLEGMLEGWKWP